MMMKIKTFQCWVIFRFGQMTCAAARLRLLSDEFSHEGAGDLGAGRWGLGSCLLLCWCMDWVLAVNWVAPRCSSPIENTALCRCSSPLADHLNLHMVHRRVTGASL